MITGAVGKHWAARPHVYGAGRVEVFCRLENLTLLSVVERYGLHVVEREHAEVHLSVLRVRQLYAVVEHSHVVGAHASYVDGLDAAHSAVVFQLHAGKEPERVGHTQAVEPLQFFALKLLRRNDTALAVAQHYHFVKSLHTVETAHMLLRIARKDSHA